MANTIQMVPEKTSTLSTEIAAPAAPPRILLLGAGFGGMATARRLERELAPSEAEIVLVSRENFSLFTPMVPEVSSGNLETRHVVTPVRAQLRRTRFVLGDVVAVDLAARRVDIVHSLSGDRLDLTFDHIVFALGSVTSTFGLPGIAERALPLKTLEDAERLRNHTIAMLELADASDGPAGARLLRFAFVGGGFTGVEAAGELVDFFKSILRFYPRVDPQMVEIHLIEGGPKLLPELQAGMGEYSARALERRGVRVHLNTMVAGADADGLNLRDGTHVSAATIVWSAGVRPAPLVASLGLGTSRGGAIAVQPDFSVRDHPGVWALGDCASIPDPAGKPYPATAQHAIREGPVLAKNIAATLRGKPTKPFVYNAIGMMASLGGRSGVAGLYGRWLLTGRLAWLLWRTYYLARLPGIDRRLRVAGDWTLGLLFPRDIAELRVYSKRARAAADSAAGVAEMPDGAE